MVGVCIKDVRLVWREAPLDHSMEAQAPLREQVQTFICACVISSTTSARLCCCQVHLDNDDS